MVGLTFRAILKEDWTLTANQNLNLQDITAFSRETRHWDLKRKPGLKEQTVSIKELLRAGSPGMRRLWIADGSRHAIRHYLTSLKIKHQSLKHLGCMAPARCNCLCNNIVHQRGRSRRSRYCKRSRRWTAHYFVNLIAACVSLSVFVTHFSTAAPKHKQTEPRARRREGEGGWSERGQEKTNGDIASHVVHSEPIGEWGSRGGYEVRGRKASGEVWAHESGRWTNRRDSDGSL